MARIDIFLDLDEVLQETVVKNRIAQTDVFYDAVRLFNRFIDYLHEQGHDLTIIPVTAYRKHANAKDVQDLYEGIGVQQGLNFVHYSGGSRSELVAMRQARGLSDAYVIFDDYADAYRDKTHLIHIVVDPNDKQGIMPVHITKAKIAVTKQLRAANLPIRAPMQTRPRGKPVPGADDVS